MLGVLMAVSADGYLCKGPDDDMRWTGPADKEVFRLLTLASPHPLFAGARTAAMMPALPNRTVVPVRSSPKEDNTLRSVACFYPGAWLIGGPTIVKAALRAGVVGTLVLCRSDAELGEGVDLLELSACMDFTQWQKTMLYLGLRVEVYRAPRE